MTGVSRFTGSFLCAIMLSVCAVPASAESPVVGLPGESRATALRLDEARKQLADSRWPEALEEFQTTLDSSGNDLVAVDAGRSVQARWLVHAAIAALPVEARRIYRGRVDRQAARWLEQGVAAHDTRLLRKVVDDAFCSTAGEKALDLLGDLAFERGQFDEALAWWRLLVPFATQPGDCAYPDPHDPARTHAKQLLAKLFAQGKTSAWDDDLDRFRDAHDTASGSLAGMKGPYAETLAKTAQRRGEDGPRDSDWSTFGGDGSRGLVPRVADPLEELGKLMQDGPTWQIPLDTRDRGDGGADPKKPLSPAALNRAMAVHPVITRTHVVVASGGRVTGVDLRSGKSQVWRDAGAFKDIQPPKFGEPAGVRWTLTTASGRLYARLGVRGIHPVERVDAGAGARPAELRTLLRCLELPPPDRPEEPATHRWRLDLDGGPGAREPAFFEGTPLAFNNQVFVAVSRFASQRLITSIDCYTDDTEPVLRWRRDVCETPEPRPDEPRFHHHLLTRAGNLLIYCSNAGAISAVDASTGQTTWAVRYPRREEEPDDDLLEPVPTKGQLARARDLAPCLFADGRLYAAPADSDRLLCLDPLTGRTLWDRERLHVVHLLGVGQGRLIFTTTGGLRAVGATDGGDNGGWMQPDTGRLAPMGRGILLGDLVLWPTVRSRPAGTPGFVVYAVRQDNGRPAADPTFLHRLPAGNLAYAHGYLAVADRDTLSIFVAPRLLVEDRRRTAADHPDAPDAWIRLGRSEADEQRFDAAVDAFRRAEKLTESGGTLAARRLREAARRGRQAALLGRGRAALKSHAPERIMEAEAAFRDAVMVEGGPETKVHALMYAADRWHEGGEPARALTAWEQVLASPELRSYSLCDESGVDVAAGSDVAVHAHQLVAHVDPALGEAVDAQARVLREAATPERMVGVAQQLLTEFPHASVTWTTLRKLARDQEKANPGIAAWAWRKILVLGIEGEEQAAALAGLARCLEQQGLPEAAEVVWRRLQEGHGSRVAAEALRHLQDRPRPSGPAFPWQRHWHVALGLHETFLAESDGGACPPLVFTVAGQVVTARRLVTGEVAWRQSLPFASTWASLWADIVVVAGPRGAVGLRLEDGGRVWDFPLPRGERWLAATGVMVGPQTPEILDGFQLARDRLFFFQGRRRLLALNAESGELLWARWAPGAELGETTEDGQFFTLTPLGAGSVLVQTSARKWWLLDAATGRVARGGPAAREPWPVAPVVLDGPTLCFVPTPRQVLAIDPETGRNRWEYRIPGNTLASGEPCHLIGSGKEVLIISPWTIGYYLNRLDAATGKPLWKRPIALPMQNLDRRGWAVDSEAVYHAHGGTLTARSLEDGRIRWERPLPPASAWTVRRIRDGLVAHPAVIPRTYFRFPWLRGAIQYVGDDLPPAQTEFPILVSDPRTGELIERLNFPSVPSVRWSDEPSVPRTVVYTGPGRSLVALGGGLWGLTTAE
jgi:outer membrane protein assembly factor BamB/tetratricopeptide (TPR) repeat protein